jgi:extradiol dioxygenase family protein
MGAVAVPHFGAHIEKAELQALKARLEEAEIPYLDEPYVRFKGTEYEQETFFIEDPNGNVLEMKSMVNPEIMFSSP